MRWKLIPKVTYTNFRKVYPTMPATCFGQILSFSRAWSGRLIYLDVWHHSICFDFRKNWVADMVQHNDKVSSGDKPR